MSEQQASITYLDEYRHTKSDGSLEMGAETNVAFHENITVPNYDERAVEAGRQMFEKTRKAELEQPRLSEVAIIGIKLATLHSVRDGFKLIEQTKFMADADEESKVA